MPSRRTPKQKAASRKNLEKARAARKSYGHKKTVNAGDWVITKSSGRNVLRVREVQGDSLKVFNQLTNRTSSVKVADLTGHRKKRPMGKPAARTITSLVMQAAAQGAVYKPPTRRRLPSRSGGKFTSGTWNR